MDFPLSSALASRLEWRESIDSTNAALLAESAGATGVEAWPDFSVLVAGFQSAGRGRSGRQWEATPGSSLFASLLLRLGPDSRVAPDSLPLLPLITGLSLLEALDRWLPEGEAGLKWPNDILVSERKLAGVLLELAPAHDFVVLGTGVNLFQDHLSLPHPEATSLALESVSSLADNLLDELLAAYLQKLSQNLALAAEPSGALLAKIEDRLLTIGREVRAVLPDGSERKGRATGIAEQGALRVRFAGAAAEEDLLVADIRHLRHIH